MTTSQNLPTSQFSIIIMYMCDLGGRYEAAASPDFRVLHKILNQAGLIIA